MQETRSDAMFYCRKDLLSIIPDYFLWTKYLFSGSTVVENVILEPISKDTACSVVQVLSSMSCEILNIILIPSEVQFLIYKMWI